MPFTWPRGSLAQLLNPKYTISRHSGFDVRVGIILFIFISCAFYSLSVPCVCVIHDDDISRPAAVGCPAAAARRAALFAAVFDLLTSGGTRS